MVNFVKTLSFTIKNYSNSNLYVKIILEISGNED